MAKYYFFTEPNKLEDNQEPNHAFGAIDENNFRLGNLISLKTKSKLFAITEGKVMVQQTSGHSDKINIILKPEVQPNLNFPKIEYFIYKGVEKASLISGSQVASRTKNDLTKTVWEAHGQLVEQEVENIGTEPLAEQALGLAYNADATDDFLATDNSPLDLAFYHNKNTLTSVDPGDHIGDVLAGEFEFIIVTEKVGVQPTFKIAREWDSKLSFSPLDEEATPKDIFERKHKKEEILAYLDSTAFFSAFPGIEVYEGTSFQPKNYDDFYDQITSKMENSNVVYLDIRNENQDSFNYFENYSDSIKLNSTQESISYYRDSWPLLKLTDTEIGSLDGNKILELHLHKGDNEAPRLILKKGFLENDDVQAEKSKIDFLNHIDFGDEFYKTEERIKAPVNNAGVIKANYFQLRYIKRYTTEDSSFNGLSLVNDTFWDNLFSITDMKLPFVKNGSVDVKVYSDIGYMDKSNINDSEYTANLGIARDEKGLHFFSLPENYSNQEFDVKAKVPLVSEQTFSDQTFLDHLQSKITSNSINQAIFPAPTKDHAYLTFAESLKEGTPEEPDDIDELNKGMTELKLEKEELAFDFDNIDILSLTNDEVDAMNTIIENEFLSAYKVHLGITNIKYLELDEDSTCTVDYILRGIVPNEDGMTIQLKEVVVEAEMLAKGKVQNESVKIKKGHEIKFQKLGSGYRNGEHGFDWYRSHYNFKSSIDEVNYKNTYEVEKLIVTSKYYIPWLSIKKDQTATLGLNFNKKRLEDFETINIKLKRDSDEVDDEFEISNIDINGKSEISIRCLKELSTTPNSLSPFTKLQVLGNNSQILGALNIVHRKFRKIEFRCVYVKWRGDEVDEKFLEPKVNVEDIEKYLTVGINPASLDAIMLSSEPEILDVPKLWSEKDSYGAGAKSVIEDNVAKIISLYKSEVQPGEDTIPSIIPPSERTEEQRQKGSVGSGLRQLYYTQRVINSEPSEIGVIPIFFGVMECVTNSGSKINGISDTGGGVSLMNMGNEKVDLKSNVIHEALHAIGLGHSFLEDENKRKSDHIYFWRKSTTNWMDYESFRVDEFDGALVSSNVPEHTWKWQWDLLYNSTYSKNY